MNEKENPSHQVHPFPPLYDARSKLLILGSFPSVKSREQKFFYGHPQNRFWKVTAAVLHEPLPQSTEEKKQMLLKHHIALWDVIGSCEIAGSSDASIKNAVPNDLKPILQQSRIERIFCNGSTAHKLYEKYLQSQTGIKAELLPSTSPANAAWSLEKLTEAWGRALSLKEDGASAQ